MSDGPSEILCAFCGSRDTELFSLFGQQLLTVQYYCNTCKTPFERIKGEDVLQDVAQRTLTGRLGDESGRTSS
ncbi:MAG: hypothetical protein ACRDFX_07495 [Chloroflexota bacterium]